MKREIVRKRRDYVKENIIKKTIKEMADEWGVHPSTIEKDLIFLRKNEGLKSKSALRDDAIAKLSAKSTRVREIAETIGTTTRDVYYRKKVLGIDWFQSLIYLVKLEKKIG